MLRLLRLCAPLLLVFALSTPLARAQPAAAEPEKTERSTSALPYVFLILYAALALTIVCMPSRKA